MFLISFYFSVFHFFLVFEYRNWYHTGLSKQAAERIF